MTAADSVVLWRWKGVLRTPAHLWTHWIEPRVSPEPNSGCWLWSHVCGRDDRAKFKVDGVTLSIARIACVVFHGAPDIMDRTWFACHHCDTPNCCNPSHIYVGNKSTNMYDDYRRGRRPLGPSTTTHCRNGHEFTAANTALGMRDGRARRMCRECGVIRQRAYLRRIAA